MYKNISSKTRKVSPKKSYHQAFILLEIHFKINILNVKKLKVEIHFLCLITAFTMKLHA